MQDDIFKNSRTLRRTISVHSIFGFGFFQVSKNQQSRIKYPAFCLVFCDKGRIKAVAAGKETEITEGNCIFFTPDTEFTLIEKGDGSRVFYAVFTVKENSISVFCGKPAGVSSFSKALLLRLNKLAPEYFAQKGIYSLSQLPEVNPDAGIFTEQSIRLLLELFIIERIKPAYKSIIADASDNDTATEAQKITAEIYEFLTAKVHERITLADVSDALFFSESYLKKAFRKETGKTIMEAFTELKTEEAKKLIALGIPFNEVAERLSFCSKNYFSKVFKDVAGVTPSEYKKSL